VFSAIPATAQKPENNKSVEIRSKTDKSEYQQLVEKVKKGDDSVDFVKTSRCFP
jgi:lantibiotic modifying enzyme